METLTDARNELNFQYSFRPIYYYSRVVGLWPFTIVHDSNGSIEKTRVRFVDALYLFISICSYLMAIFFTFTKLKPNAASYVHFIFFIFQTTSLLLGVCAVVLDMFNRNKLANILKMLTAFDNEVGCFFYFIFALISNSFAPLFH